MFNIDRMSRIPIYEQFIAQFEHAIVSGELKGGEHAPSVRSLSVALSVNPNTLQKAYTELERRKLCYSVPGNGRFVASNAAEIIKSMKLYLLEDIENLCRELKLSGVSEEEVKAIVHEAFMR